MRKAIAILILISLFTFGCKTKKVMKTQSKEIEKIESISKSETIQKEDSKKTESAETKQIKKEEKSEEKSETQISGKVDKENPVTYYNVVNGDTIDLFKITGNADFIFKSSKSSQNSSLNNETSAYKSNESKDEKSVSNAVENVKNTVKEVQTKTVEVVKKDFTIGAYIVFLLWGLAIIILLILIMWLRKSTFFTGIISKIKNKLSW